MEFSLTVDLWKVKTFSGKFYKKYNRPIKLIKRMEKKTGFSTLDEFLQSPDDLKQKLILLKRTGTPFLKKLDAPNRIK